MMPDQDYFSTLETYILQFLLPNQLTDKNSTGRPRNAFQLPRSETDSSCRMIIGLSASAVAGENGSWAGVGLNAGQLNLQCVQYGVLKEFYGGSTTAGDNGLITIVLLYSGRSSGSELGDNETAIASL